MHIHYKNLHITYRVFSYTYFMTYSSGFVIIIPDKMTISVVSWHPTDPVCTGHPACIGDPAYIQDPACIRSFTVQNLCFDESQKYDGKEAYISMARLGLILKALSFFH